MHNQFCVYICCHGWLFTVTSVAPDAQFCLFRILRKLLIEGLFCSQSAPATWQMLQIIAAYLNKYNKFSPSCNTAVTAGSSYHLNLALPNNDNTIFWFKIIFCKSYWLMENNWFSVWTYHILERSCTWKLCPSVLNCLLLACHDLNMFCSCQGVKAKAHGIDKSWQAHMSSSRKTDSCSQHHPEVLTAFGHTNSHSIWDRLIQRLLLSLWFFILFMYSFLF